MNNCHQVLRVSLLITAMLSISSCDTLQGTNIGGVRLDPLLSAGKKLSNSNEITEPQEIEIGGHMAGALLGSAPLDADATMQTYVNRVGNYLVGFSGRPTLKFHFGVLADDGYNAFAAPGGYIFVTRGLMKDLKSEAELACVLAHEINHVVKKHHLKAIQRSQRMGALGDVAGAVADSRVAQAGPAAQMRREAVEKLMNVTKDLYTKGLDKDDEFQSDANGMTLAARAGYDPYALIAVLQRLQARSPDDSNFKLLFDTHPKAEVRIQALTALSDAGFPGTHFAIQEDRYHKETKF